MKIRLRQVALVAEDLAAVERAIEQELGVELCFRDPGVGTFGLHNALFPIGDKLLEVVSPTEDGTTAGRLLEKRHGDGGYMVILQVEDLDELRRRFAEQGVRVVFEAQGEGIVGLHLHPRDVGGAILSVDCGEDWAAWPWAGPVWRDHVVTNRVTDLVAAEVQAADPAAMAERWAAVLGRAVRANDGAAVVDLDEGTSVRFVELADDRGEGVTAIDVVAAPGEPARDVALGGITVHVRSA